MRTRSRTLLAACLLASLLSPLAAFAQAPPPVPALPDTERRTTYSLTASNCACSVGFAIYGDSTDYQDWIEVWLNGVLVAYNDATYGWAITSVTGPLATIPRPITDAVLTFTNAQTGTVQIVGARRPRRLSQFNENQGVPARNLNQVITDLVAQNRETWDKANDLTGRGLFFAPGNTTGPMPLPAACANGFLGFDSTGLNPLCVVGVGTGNVVGPAPSTVGHVAIFNNTIGTLLADSGLAYTSLATLTGTQTLTNKTLTSPILTTPTLGVATGTSLALGGCTIGSNALCVTGLTNLAGATTIAGASFGLSGNISSAAWTTSGVRYKNVAATLTDTSSSGTVAAAYTDLWGGNTIAASSATTFTNYYGAYFKAPIAGTNVTLTNKYALGADSINTTSLAIGGAAAATTINSTSCALGGSCTVSTSASSLTVGTTTVASGTDLGFLYQNGSSPTGTVGNTAAGGMTWAGSGSLVLGNGSYAGALLLNNSNNGFAILSMDSTNSEIVDLGTGMTPGATNGTLQLGALNVAGGAQGPVSGVALGGSVDSFNAPIALATSNTGFVSTPIVNLTSAFGLIATETVSGSTFIQGANIGSQYWTGPTYLVPNCALTFASQAGVIVGCIQHGFSEASLTLGHARGYVPSVVPVSQLYDSDGVATGIIYSTGSLVGGSSCPTGTYKNVPLSGGSGNAGGANATVVVNADGTVHSGGLTLTPMTVNYETGHGFLYSVGDVLTVPSASVNCSGGSQPTITVSAVYAPPPGIPSLVNGGNGPDEIWAIGQNSGWTNDNTVFLGATTGAISNVSFDYTTSGVQNLQTSGAYRLSTNNGTQPLCEVQANDSSGAWAITQCGVVATFTIVSGGTGGTPGTYSNTALSDCAGTSNACGNNGTGQIYGSSLTANIVVNSSGIVSATPTVGNNAGKGYIVGQLLTAAPGSVSGLVLKVATLASVPGPISFGTVTGGVWNGTTIAAAYLPVATASVEGIVQGDGSTLTISSGTISCTTATSSQIGCAKFGTGLTVSSGSVTPTFGTATNQVAEGGVITAGGPTGSATVAPIITYNAAGQLTAVTSATITPAVGSITGLGTGIATALGVNVGTAGAPVVLGGAGGTPSSINLANATAYPAATTSALGIVEIGAGLSVASGIISAGPVPTQSISSTGNTFTGTEGVAICTTTCTITPPVPAAGYQFCVMNGDNISTVITLAALGSSAKYESTARTSYGTAGTGTLTSGGAAGDMICIVGLDSTHYLSPTYVGTWTASWLLRRDIGGAANDNQPAFLHRVA